jgi:hypothetical protein
MESPESIVAAAIAAARGTGVARLGLRFDRVVERVRSDLRAQATPAVPDAATILVTITAPIRQPAKTVESIAAKVHSLVRRSGTPRRDLTAELYGNRVRLRLWFREAPSSPRLWLFVHNLDVDAKQLLDDACTHGCALP